jgi:hypothetical protein
MALPIVDEFLNVADGATNSVTFKTSPTNIVGVRQVSILTDELLHIATTVAGLGVSPSGLEGDRISVPGGATFLTLPWGRKTELHFKNVSGNVADRVQIIGLV